MFAQHHAAIPRNAPVSAASPYTENRESSADVEMAYHPYIVLSTPSQYAPPASSTHSSSDWSNRPRRFASPLAQEKLHSPWCAPSPLLLSRDDVSMETTEMERWQVGRVRAGLIVSASFDSQLSARSDQSSYASSSTEHLRDNAPTGPAWHIPGHASPWLIDDPMADYDEIDYLPLSGASSYTSLPALGEAEFEPRSLHYPPAPKVESAGWMEDPLAIPDYACNDIWTEYACHSEQSHLSHLGNPSPNYDGDVDMGMETRPFDAASQGVRGGLRSPWASSSELEAECFFRTESAAVADKERKMLATREMGGGVVGLGI